MFSSLSVKILDVDGSTNALITLEWIYIRQERYKITFGILTRIFFNNSREATLNYKEESNSYWDTKFSNTS